MFKRLWIAIVFLLVLGGPTLAQEVTPEAMQLPAGLTAMNDVNLQVFRLHHNGICLLSMFATNLSEEMFPVNLRLGRFQNTIGSYDEIYIEEMPETGQMAFSVEMNERACESNLETRTIFTFVDGSVFTLQASDQETVAEVGVLADLLMWQNGENFQIFISPIRATFLPEGKYELFVQFVPSIDSDDEEMVIIEEFESVEEMLAFTVPFDYSGGQLFTFIMLTETDEVGNQFRTANRLYGMQFSSN